jgi:predicted transcriptional regulator
MSMAMMIIKGDKIITPTIQINKSKTLFKIFAQLFKEVVFISITGILFMRERVVFVFVTSKEFVIYLYLTQKVLVNSHNSNNSFLSKSLSIFNISSHFFFSKRDFISSIEPK